MAISVSCPSCERELKVKDELAGRKVKCPKCGEGVVVPAEDEDEDKVAASAAPRKASRHEDEEEERPRKKKKKKKKDNNVLLLACGLGGVLLLGVVILVIVLNLPKDRPPRPLAKAPEGPPVEVVQAKPAEKEPEKGRFGTGARAAGDQLEIQNDLKQFGIFWNQYRAEFGKPPRDWKTFKPYLRTAGSIVEKIEQGKYRVVLGAQAASNAVLAYEWPQDSTFQHIVVMGDGSVDRILNQRLLELVPNAGKEPLPK